MIYHLSAALRVVVICYASVMAGLGAGAVAYLIGAYVAGRKSVSATIIFRDAPENAR